MDGGVACEVKWLSAEVLTCQASYSGKTRGLVNARTYRHACESSLEIGNLACGACFWG